MDSDENLLVKMWVRLKHVAKGQNSGNNFLKSASLTSANFEN